MNENRVGETPPSSGAAPSGPNLDGARIELPPSGTKRWVPGKKASVVNAVSSGQLSLDDACERYGLSVDEFMSWQRLVNQHGLRGLRVTHLQDYRVPAMFEQPRRVPRVIRADVALPSDTT